MQEKSFEQKLHSLQIGCIIIGLLQLFSLVSAINNYSDGTGGLGTLILSLLILGIIYIVLGAGILKEANWFQNYINNINKNDTDNNMQ